MSSTRKSVQVVALGVALSLAACAALPPQPRQPQPSPVTAVSPTLSTPASSARHPALQDLVITPAGIGSLLIGHSVSETDMVRYDAEFCGLDETGQALDANGQPYEIGRWVANYPGDFPFGVPFTTYVKDGVIEAIEVLSSTLATGEGIRVGSSLSDLRAANPTLTPGVEGHASRTFFLAAPTGELVFEVMTSDVYESHAPDTVYRIQVNEIGAHLENPYAIHPYIGTDAVIGGCL